MAIAGNATRSGLWGKNSEGWCWFWKCLPPKPKTVCATIRNRKRLWADGPFATVRSTPPAKTMTVYLSLTPANFGARLQVNCNYFCRFGSVAQGH